MKYLRRLTTPICLPNWSQDLTFLLPRIVCGYLLTVEFGASKFGMPWSPAENNLGLFEIAFWFPNDVSQFGGIFKLFPNFFAWMAGFSEAIGGLLLIIGFQTRISAALIVATMLVAIFCQQLSNGLWNCLPAMGILAVALQALILGSGRFGLDYLLTRKK